MKLIFSELGQVVLVPSHCLQVDIQLTFVPNRVRLNWQDLMTLRPICTNDDTCLTAIFQDNRDMPVSECILSLFLILLELRMMEVVVTTGAIRHVMKLQSKLSAPTNDPSVLEAGCRSCHPTNDVKALKGKFITSHWLAHPKLIFCIIFFLNLLYHLNSFFSALKLCLDIRNSILLNSLQTLKMTV